MREIVLDTETTGFDPGSGHRLVEIGCVELYNRLPTGRFYHTYINPERDMPEDAFKVHGLSAEFLSQHRLFREIYDEFLNFIEEDIPLVIHNARFDMNFRVLRQRSMLCANALKWIFPGVKNMVPFWTLSFWRKCTWNLQADDKIFLSLSRNA